MTFKCISIIEAEELIKAGEATLLDVRDPASFANGNIPNSINLSNQNVGNIIATSDKDKPVIIYCYHGNSSKNAADYFANNGFNQAYSVDGGYEVWKLRYL